MEKLNHALISFLDCMKNNSIKTKEVVNQKLKWENIIRKIRLERDLLQTAIEMY